MKLLYITNGITGAGGLERVLSVKASLLADDFGYEVHILSLNEKNAAPFFSFSDKIIRHSVAVGGNPVKYFTQYFIGIRNKVTEIKPDIISVCDDGLKGFFLPHILGKKVPIVYERHVSQLIELASHQNAFSRTLSGFRFQLMNRLATSFDRFVVLTAGNVKEWNLKNISIIPNPLPFYPSTSSSWENKKVIAVGKQSYQKAYDLLLMAWSKLPTDLQDWGLHIYGKYDETLQLDSLAKKLGISDKVFFHLPEKDIESKFIGSSVFVLSSRFEGFGMVIIEAMACGLPVVSFDCPHGPADIITDEKDGFLIENGNTEKFAQRLSVLMRDPELRKQLGAQGRETALRYSPEMIVQKWEILFTQLINERNSK